MKKTLQALVVTTQHRGVFFGYAEPTNEKTITLSDARMCVYWPAGQHGVLGLASNGPKPGSKITPKVDKITLQDVTSIMEASDASVLAWEKEIWS